MKVLVLPLALLLVAACGSSSKKSDAKTGGSSTASADGSVLVAVYEIREQDGGAKVGTLYKRDHGQGRILYWADDAKGTRRGYITPSNQAFAYEWVMGKRSDTAYFIGEDTLVASARRVIGHDRAVSLEQIDIDTWVRQGTSLERPKQISKPSPADDESASDE